jgi:hypothetical protein
MMQTHHPKGALSISARASRRRAFGSEICAKSLLKLWKAELPPAVVANGALECAIAVSNAREDTWGFWGEIGREIGRRKGQSVHGLSVSGEIKIWDSGEYGGDISTLPTRLEVVRPIFTLPVRQLH